LIVAGSSATTLVGLGLLDIATAADRGPVCLAAGIALLVLVPFIPVLIVWRRRRRPIRSRVDPHTGPLP
jgi:hypothetical protein